MSEAVYRCTLPECECGDFTPGKAQLKTCDHCRHGWVAHDLITEAQAKKIRKKGVKDGTPCQVGICACGNYQRPPGVPKTSWLAVCDNCKHSETEHRYPTKLDKTRKHNHEKAASHSCVGCEFQCPGFQQPDDESSQSTSQASKKCYYCNHVIDTHRPWTSLDSFISEELDACHSRRCHSSVPAGNKQTSRSCPRDCPVDDDAFLDAWLEPTNIDRDEDVPFLDSNVCQCKGFCFDDMARICNQYFGFTEGIVGPHLPNLACQSCSHALKHHRRHTDKELDQLDLRKKSNLTMLGVVSFPATSNPGYPNNICLHLHEDASKLSHYNVLLAATQSRTSECGSDYSNTITVSDSNFSIHHHHQHDRFPSSSSKGDMEESDEEKENDVQQPATSTTTTMKSGKKRVRKMSRIMDDVKKKIKRRRLVSKGQGAASESDTEAVDDEDSGVGVRRALSKLRSDPLGSIPYGCQVTAVSWSHQAGMLAVATDYKHLKIHSRSDMYADSCLPDDTGLCTCITWSHSDKWIVSGHACGTSLLWKVPASPKGEMESSLLTQSGTRARVVSICISGDDRYIALGYQDSVVCIFDTRKGSGAAGDHGLLLTPQLLSTCSTLYGAVLCMAWHPTKLLLVAGGEDDRVTAFFMKKPASQPSRGTLKHFFTRSPRRPVKKGFQECAALKGHKSFVSALTFDPSGTFLLSAGWDGQLLFWNVADIDDAIDSDDIDNEIVCSSGFVMGRSSRGQMNTGMLRPYVPQHIALFDRYAVVAYRTSVNRVSLTLYEIPGKFAKSLTKIE